MKVIVKIVPLKLMYSDCLVADSGERLYNKNYMDLKYTTRK